MLEEAALSLWQTAKDALLPPQCLTCGARLAEGPGLCAACWREMAFIDQPLCDRLGIPLEGAITRPMVSARALTDPPAWNRARAGVHFERLPRELVHGLKYHDRFENAGLMARLMARAGAELLEEADLLIPVPLHPFRLWWRRFNQSALLAAEISRAEHVRHAPLLLRRRRATLSQVRLGRRERQGNLAGAFYVREADRPHITGRRVVLIDDVLTTGATATAATLALKAAGAARVDVLVFALVAEPQRPHI